MRAGHPLIPTITVLLLLLGCGSSVPKKDLYDPANPLPDLFIRKISYRSLGPSNRIRPRATRLALSYEFRVQIENAGNAPASDPFYLSFTTSQDDYSSNIYSKHELLNDSRHLIIPGKSFTFVVLTDIEFSTPRVPSFFQIRFLINPESTSMTVGSANTIREHDYRNNVHELSMRISTR